MLRMLTEPQAKLLNVLSNKYLVSTDEEKTSIEITFINEIAVVFYHYAPNAEGVEVTMPWFEFVISVLAPVMFKSQSFKFNGIMSKCVMRPAESREDLMSSLYNFEVEITAKEEKKEEDAKNKAKLKEKEAKAEKVEKKTKKKETKEKVEMKEI